MHPVVPGCAVADCKKARFKSGYCAFHFSVQNDPAKSLAAVLGGGSGGGEEKSRGSASSSNSNNSSSSVGRTFGNSANKWWEKKEVVHTAWQPCVTADGLDYYYNTDTKETSWDKPEELMTPAELDAKGKWVWVPDETECYVPGRVVIETGTKTNVTLEDGTEKTVLTKEILPLSRSSLKRLVSDLVLLDSMSSPLILHNLRQRFQQKLIYTNIGTILISVNPYKDLDLYNQQVTRQYINRKLGQELPPHVFNVAYDSFYGLREFHQNQSIIISGESGAGKTEATKQCLAFLAASAGSVSHVHRKILQANPVLEAFGNAKTIRNDNSSRFGKFIRVFFSDQMRISGSLTQNYLLEKIRVCQQSLNERNFHIFYQLTKGKVREEKKEFGLEQPSYYRYLRTCADVSTIDDNEGLKETQDAMKELGFSGEEMDHLFRTVSAILALGNIQFKEEGNKSIIATDEKKTQHLVSKLLQVEVEKLISALTVRELRIKGQTTTLVDLSTKDCSDTRDALAKFMYGEMFNWLVGRINRSMGDNPKTPREIGILDIFGFEIFDHNTFEQLCINFTNEMLQQHFNHHTFRLEEQVYKSEGIQFKHIEFIDNQPMLDLITKKPTGILPLLDEELIMPKGSDATFLSKAHEIHDKNPVYKKVLKTPKFFIVKHYAGDVTYDTDGFLEKNRDTLTDDVLQMLYTSSSPFIQKLFPSSSTVSTKDKKKSLSSQFQDQLNSLMSTLNLTSPHYIRCVKPNHSKSSETFIPRIVYEQLTYSGVFEAVAIRKQGFPFRLSHAQFTDRYSVIFTDGKKVFEGDKLEGCKKVLEKMKLNNDNVQIGKTMILYRADEHKKLELDHSIKVRTIEVVENIIVLLGCDVTQFTDEQKEEHFSNLARSVTDADRFKLSDPACTKARAALEAYVEARMDSQTKRMLEEAHSSMNQAKLVAVLEICEEKGYATKLTRACREMLEQIDEAEAMLKVAIDDRNCEYLTQAIAFCESFHYTKAPNFTHARTLLDNIAKANEQLKRVRTSLNHEHMKICLDFCASFAYHTSEVDIVSKLYKKILSLRQALTKAQHKVDEALLEEAVEGCDRVHYSCDLVEDCRTLLRRVKRINEEAKRADKTYEEDHIAAVVKAAKEIGLSGKLIKHFSALVDGPKQEFLKAQYDKAVSLQDHNRAIRIGIQRKDLLILQQRDNFVLEKYTRLKNAFEWSGEKFWGDKNKRAENMLKYQKDTLHSPFTHIPFSDPRHEKYLRAKINNCFESVQKYMDQRNTSKLDQRVHELLTDSLENEEIRTEVYIGLIKQTRANPEPQSVAQAWELIALCLTVFPPSPDFEDYLERFVRDNPEMNTKYSLSGLLRQRSYHGPIKMQIKREQFGSNQVEVVQTSVKQMIQVATPNFQVSETKHCSWKDLNKKFDSKHRKKKGNKQSEEEDKSDSEQEQTKLKKTSSKPKNLEENSDEKHDSDTEAEKVKKKKASKHEEVKSEVKEVEKKQKKKKDEVNREDEGEKKKKKKKSKEAGGGEEIKKKKKSQKNTEETVDESDGKEKKKKSKRQNKDFDEECTSPRPTKSSEQQVVIKLPKSPR